MCGSIYEFHLLFPIHRQHTRLPTCSDPSSHGPSLLPSLFVFNPQLMALWTHGRTLLPHCHCLCDIRGWPDHLHVDTSDGASILCHVPTSHGIFFSLPADIAVGFGNCCASKDKESRGACFGYCGFQRHEHRYCIPLSRMECTVSTICCLDIVN